jgi:uncharacterized protein
MITTAVLVRAARAPESMLRLVAAANALFFASFLAIALIAAGQARAAGSACTGHEMLSGLPAEKLKQIEADAAKTPNGDARLWKIEKAGLKPSYLFGTMHMTDPRVISLTPEAQTVYDGADTVVIETTEILDQKKAAAALMAKPELMMFTDATTLSSLVKPADLDALEKGLAARGIPLMSVNKMKPWMIAGLVALPACEIKRKNGGAPFLDIKLAQDALASGKKIDGLETMAEQIGAMASLPMDFHVQGLVDTLKLGSEMENVMETMIVLYTQGRTGMIMPFLKSVAPESANDSAKYGDFEEIMVNARNKVMAERAEKILANGNAFIAVGALHLSGKQGLVEKFREAGYTVIAAGK